SDQFKSLAKKTGLGAIVPLHSNTTLPKRVPLDWVIVRKTEISESHMKTIRRVYARDFDQLGYNA
ncbi:MAG: hypothetical protein AAGD34_22510, partial [Pseudomonadota bacterium]